MMGLICIKFGITIYAFTLMPNHIHIILQGDGEACLKAFDLLVRKLSARLVKDGYSPLPPDYWFNLERIDSEEKMRTEIIYVLRNCLEKGLGVVGGYLWSSAWLYHSNVASLLNCTPVQDVSKRRLGQLLMGHDTLPDHWLLHPVLGLSPESFVDTSMVLRLFPEPKDLQTALVKDYELFFQIARRLGELQEFNKSEISEIVSLTLQKRFSGKDLRQLTDEEKGRLAIILNRDFGLNSYQISTAVYIREKTVRQLLASKELR
ncbi:MAG: hypothetical protein IK052_00985 [Bacteroidales bacterium]|nr:hypothetical protein [Bacteroidales bacterium]